jgi:hypothetical protein
VQSSPNVGFGVDDHLIKELIRFVKMTSREFMKEDAIWKGGAPNHLYGRYLAQRRFKFFYRLNLSLGKLYY